FAEVYVTFKNVFSTYMCVMPIINIILITVSTIETKQIYSYELNIHEQRFKTKFQQTTVVDSCTCGFDKNRKLISVSINNLGNINVKELSQTGFKKSTLIL
ncbi:hypothetical protein L9F63_007130, partial [Diploptera punctata]